MNFLRKAIIIGIAPIFLSFSAIAEVKVVTTIKPLHSLVSGVMDGVSNPTLIIEGSNNPHNFSLKPSHAKMLEEADIVFWIGEDLESFMEKPLSSLAKDAVKISFMDLPSIEKLKFREKNIFDDHDDHGHDDHDGHEDEHEGHDDHKDHDDHGHDDHAGHGHGDHAFEWAGVFELSAGTYKWSFAKVDGAYADPAMKMAIVASDHIEDSEEAAEAMLESDDTNSSVNNDVLRVSDKAYTLNFDDSKDMTVFTVKIEKDGAYTFFTEHMPFEFEASEHFFKDLAGADVEPIAQEPDMGHHDEHHGEHAHKGHDDHDDHGHHGTDPHVWLDPVNAKAMIHEIEEALIEADPANASAYEANAEAMMSKLDDLVAEIDAELQPVKGRGYVVFHDAYQYFENRFGVSAVGSITVSPEVLPGAERVAELRDKVRNLDATCVFSEPQFEPKLVMTITENTNAGTGVLDPLGASINDGPELYFTLIRNMAKSLKDCLLK